MRLRVQPAMTFQKNKIAPKATVFALLLVDTTAPLASISSLASEYSDVKAEQGAAERKAKTVALGAILFFQNYTGLTLFSLRKVNKNGNLGCRFFIAVIASVARQSKQCKLIINAVSFAAMLHGLLRRFAPRKDKARHCEPHGGAAIQAM